MVAARQARAAVFDGPHSIRIGERPLDALAPGTVRVRLEGCGVCGSNLPVWEGRPWFHYPFPAGAPGHEGWGRVAEVGAGVASVRPGDRVALLSYQAFGEFDEAPEAHVIALPASLGSEPFPGEALGCAVNVLRRCEIRSGQTVAVIGVGFLGALLVQLAARAGARVIAASRRPFALETAKRCGAEETVPLDDPSAAARAILERTGGNGCERVLEATGAQVGIDLATEISGERARLVIAGYHQDGLRTVNLQRWNWRGLDVINAHERDPRIYAEGIREAARLVDRGDLDPAPLYTHRFALRELPAAFRHLGTRPDRFLKALATYE